MGGFGAGKRRRISGNTGAGLLSPMKLLEAVDAVDQYDLEKNPTSPKHHFTGKSPAFTVNHVDDVNGAKSIALESKQFFLGLMKSG